MRADAYFLGDQSSDSPSTLSAQKPFGKPGLGADISRMFGNLVVRMAGKQEPQIWQTRNHAGDILWNVYDPTTDQTSVFYSESDVRSWLDERYNY